jgi:hypothetical protein
MTGRDGYLRAREYLRRDFHCRCAYCMIHEQQIGGLEAFSIDHFQPRSKGGRTNDYANLYWACMGCNRIKGDGWPSPSERHRGWRFADPCKEEDYGVHFAENEQAELVPRTSCGEYHLRMLRLNRPYRVARRRERNEFKARLAEAVGLVERLEHQPPTRLESEVIVHLRREIELLQSALAIAIPFLPAQESPVSADEED